MSAPSPCASPLPATDSLGELLAIEGDEAFLRAAYASLLGRPADDDGMATYARHLREGAPRLNVVAALAESPEGRARPRRLPGLAPLLRRRRLARWPVLGPLFDLLASADQAESLARELRAVRGVLRQQQEQLARIEAALQALPAVQGGGPWALAGAGPGADAQAGPEPYSVDVSRLGPAARDFYFELRERVLAQR